MADGRHGKGRRISLMNALLVGCGSIGRRHITNLIDSDRIKKVLLHTQNRDCVKGLDDKGKVSSIGTLDGIKADFAIIANDTFKHIDTALKLADNNIHLFIEKPLSHNRNRVDVLRKQAQEKDLKICVGYNLRFLGIMKYIKDALSRDELGDLYFGKIEVGQYLPLWRKGSDYRKSYSVSSEGGGGVALDLSHELDYMRHLFGDPTAWKVLRSKAGDLEMDAESIFEGTYLFHNNFICNVHMDCLQKDVKRSLRIEGSRGSLMCDLMGKVLTVSTDKGVTIMNDKELFNVKRTYRDELDHFIDIIEQDADPAVPLDDGAAVLRLIEDSEE